MVKKYKVELIELERQELLRMVSTGSGKARQIRRANVLLMSAAGKTDEQIAELLHINAFTVYKTRKRWCEERLGRALADEAKPGRSRKLTGTQEAYLVALACSQAPEGREHWTLQLLADKLLELKVIDEPISYETVRDRLKKTNSNRG